MKNKLTAILGLSAISLSLGFSIIGFDSNYEPPKQEVQYNAEGVKLYKALFEKKPELYQIPDKELKELEKKLNEPEREPQSIRNLIAGR